MSNDAFERAKEWRQTNWYGKVYEKLDEVLAAYGEVRFRAGEEAMRERAAEAAEMIGLAVAEPQLGATIRALPLTGDEESTR